MLSLVQPDPSAGRVDQISQMNFQFGSTVLQVELADF
jgi:hypothetical protein